MTLVRPEPAVPDPSARATPSAPPLRSSGVLGRLAAGQCRAAVTFAGQGVEVLPGIAALIDRRPELHPRLESAGAVLADLVASPAGQSSGRFRFGFDLAEWVLDPEGGPPESYLRSCAVSYPLVLLSQLLAWEELWSLGFGEAVEARGVVAVTGHSQGLLAALAVAESPVGPLDDTRLARYLELAFFQGLHKAGAATGVAPPMAAVSGVRMSRLAEVVDEVNASLVGDQPGGRDGMDGAPTAPGVAIGLINAPERAVVSGEPFALDALRHRLDQIAAAEAAERRTGRRGGAALQHRWEPLQVDVAFHSPVLEGPLRRHLDWLASARPLPDPADLALPVLSPFDGRDLSQLGGGQHAGGNPGSDPDPAAAPTSSTGGRSGLDPGGAEAEASGDVLAGGFAEIVARSQFVQPVRWDATVAELVRRGADWILDLGPGTGVAHLTGRNVRGSGTRVVPLATPEGHRILVTPGVAPEGPDLRYADFAPGVVELPDGTRRVDNRYSRRTGQPPVILPGMTPTTCDVPIVAAAANAGFTAELAGGGQPTAWVLRERMAELRETLVPGASAVFNALFLDRPLWDLQVAGQGLLFEAKQAGVPLVGLTVSAGVPEADEAVALLDRLSAAGMVHNAFKPGTVEQVRQVLAIADAAPHHTVFVHLEGGKAGGHHSFEDLDELLLATYHDLRRRPNVVLCVGGGIGTPERAAELLTGRWSTVHGEPIMPVDAVLVGTAAMACAEAAASPQVKAALTAAPGTPGWVPRRGVAGGIYSGRSNLNADIHILDNAAARAADLLLEVIGDEAAIAARRDEIVEALSRTAKPYFGDLDTMTYAAVLARFAELCAIGRGRRYDDGAWGDPTWRSRALDLYRRFAARLAPEDRGRIVPPVGRPADLDDPAAALARFRHAYPHADELTLHPADRLLFLEVCDRVGKPVPFVPVLDTEARRWYMADALWQAQDDRYDADAVFVIPGPESVAGITRVDEPVAGLLARFEQATLDQLEAAGVTPVPRDRLADDGLAPAPFGALAQGRSGPLAALCLEPFLVEGAALDSTGRSPAGADPDRSGAAEDGSGAAPPSRSGRSDPSDQPDRPGRSQEDGSRRSATPDRSDWPDRAGAAEAVSGAAPPCRSGRSDPSDQPDRPGRSQEDGSRRSARLDRSERSGRRGSPRTAPNPLWQLIAPVDHVAAEVAADGTLRRIDAEPFDGAPDERVVAELIDGGITITASMPESTSPVGRPASSSPARSGWAATDGAPDPLDATRHDDVTEGFSDGSTPAGPTTLSGPTRDLVLRVVPFGPGGTAPFTETDGAEARAAFYEGALIDGSRSEPPVATGAGAQVPPRDGATAAGPSDDPPAGVGSVRRPPDVTTDDTSWAGARPSSPGGVRAVGAARLAPSAGDGEGMAGEALPRRTTSWTSAPDRVAAYRAVTGARHDGVPLDWAFSLAWPALARLLVDGDLAPQLAHLVHHHHRVEPGPAWPPQPDERGTAEAQVVAIRNGASDRQIDAAVELRSDRGQLAVVEAGLLVGRPAPPGAPTELRRMRHDREVIVRDRADLDLLVNHEALRPSTGDRPDIAVGDRLHLVAETLTERARVDGPARFRATGHLVPVGQGWVESRDPAPAPAEQVTHSETDADQISTGAGSTATSVPGRDTGTSPTALVVQLDRAGDDAVHPVDALVDALLRGSAARRERPRRELARVEDLAPEDMTSFALIGGDHNPLHRSRLAARLASLDEPIVHGMWTAARAEAAVVDEVCDGDPGRLADWSVRFTAPVPMGCLLGIDATRVAVDGGRLRVEVVVRNADAPDAPDASGDAGPGPSGGGAGEVVAMATALVAPPRTALVFPGQGIQQPGLGADARARFRAARAVWERADAHTRAYLGFSLLDVVDRNPTELVLARPAIGTGAADAVASSADAGDVQAANAGGAAGSRTATGAAVAAEAVGTGTVLGAGQDGGAHRQQQVLRHPSGVLHRTEVTQVALVTLAAAQLAELRAAGALPDDLLSADVVAAGHSVGEFSALVALGVLELEAALDLVYRRGEAMQAVVPRGPNSESPHRLAAVDPRLLGDDGVAALDGLVAAISGESGDLLQVVNRNGEGRQYVVAGTQPGTLDVLARRLHALSGPRAGGGAVPGPAMTVLAGIDVPFHSSVLAPAVDRFRPHLEAAVDRLDHRRLVRRWVPNLIGRPFTLDPRFVAEVVELTGSTDPVLLAAADTTDRPHAPGPGRSNPGPISDRDDAGPAGASVSSPPAGRGDHGRVGVPGSPILADRDRGEVTTTTPEPAVPDPDDLARRLLVELLAHQLANPVRWVDVQRALVTPTRLGGLGIARQVEVAPPHAAVLTNLAPANVAGVTPAPLEVLHAERDRDRVLFADLPPTDDEVDEDEITTNGFDRTAPASSRPGPVSEDDGPAASLDLPDVSGGPGVVSADNGSAVSRGTSDVDGGSGTPRGLSGAPTTGDRATNPGATSATRQSSPTKAAVPPLSAPATTIDQRLPAASAQNGVTRGPAGAVQSGDGHPLSASGLGEASPGRSASRLSESRGEGAVQPGDGHWLPASGLDEASPGRSTSRSSESRGSDGSVEAMPGEGGSAPEDRAVTAADALRFVLAVQARVRLDQLDDDETLEDLFQGVSSRRNQVLIDLGREFGLSGTEGVPEVPLARLATEIASRAPRYRFPGDYLRDTISAGLGRALGRAGLSRRDALGHLSTAWGLGPGLAEHVLAVVALETRPGESARGGPLGRFGRNLPERAAAARELLDRAVEVVSGSLGLGRRPVMTSATARVDQEAVRQAGARLERALVGAARHLLSALDHRDADPASSAGSDRDEARPPDALMPAEVAAANGALGYAGGRSGVVDEAERLAILDRELGENRATEVAGMFDHRRHVCFASGWAAARWDLVSLYHDARDRRRSVDDLRAEAARLALYADDPAMRSTVDWFTTRARATGRDDVADLLQIVRTPRRTPLPIPAVRPTVEVTPDGTPVARDVPDPAPVSPTSVADAARPASSGVMPGVASPVTRTHAAVTGAITETQRPPGPDAVVTADEVSAGDETAPADVDGRLAELIEGLEAGEPAAPVRVPEPDVRAAYATTLRRALAEAADFSSEVALVTGASPGSIAAELVRHLLRGGATVVVATSTDTPERRRWYRELYRTAAAPGAALHVLPANLASFADIDALVAWLADPVIGVRGRPDLEPGPLVPTLLAPFAAAPTVGDARDAGPDAETAMRVQLLGVERLTASIAELAGRRGAPEPVTVLLPLSPNHGDFGGDGPYGETKAALEVLVRRSRAERDSWGQHARFLRARIGWVRGTGLMRQNDLVAPLVEERLGIRTFAPTEMGWLLATACQLHRDLSNRTELADLTDSGNLAPPGELDLTGGLAGVDGLRDAITPLADELLSHVERQRRQRPPDDGSSIEDDQTVAALPSFPDVPWLAPAPVPPDPVDDRPTSGSRSGSPAAAPPSPPLQPTLPPGSGDAADPQSARRAATGSTPHSPASPPAPRRSAAPAQGHQDMPVPDRTPLSPAPPPTLSSTPHEKPAPGPAPVDTPEPVGAPASPASPPTPASTPPTPVSPSTPAPTPTLAPEDMVVIVGTGELGPCGTALSRFALELGGPLPAAVVVELAWLCGLARFERDGYRGRWVDAASGEVVDEAELADRYADAVAERVGLRPLEPDGVIDPAGLDVLAAVQLDADVTFEVASEAEARSFLDADPTHTRIHRVHHGHLPGDPGSDPGGDGTWQVTRTAGTPLRARRQVGHTRRVVGQFPTGLDLARFGVPGDLLVTADRLAVVNLACTAEAFRQAGLEPEELLQAVHPALVANTQGCGMGGMVSVRRLLLDQLLGDERQGDRLQESLGNVVAAHVVQGYVGSYGPMVHPVAACATAAVSLEEAWDKIRLGKARAVVAGGFDDLIPEGMVGFGDMHATASSDELEAMGLAPGESSRANDVRRRGFVESQGGGSLLVVRGDVAVELGLPVLGVLAYAGTFGDGVHTSIPAPGLGLLAAGSGGSASPLAEALRRHGLTADDIAVVSKHDTSTEQNDPNEADLHQRLQQALGRTPGNPLLVVSQKTVTGHPKGGAAAWQVAGVLQMTATGHVPGNRNLESVDPQLRASDHLVHGDRALRLAADEPVRAALVTSLGFGHVSALLALAHPGTFLAALPDDVRDDYLGRANHRRARATRSLLAVRYGEVPPLRRSDRRVGVPPSDLAAAREAEAAALLDPTTRLVPAAGGNGSHNGHVPGAAIAAPGTSGTLQPQSHPPGNPAAQQ